MARKLNTMTVQRSKRLTDHMVRVFLGGAGFDELELTEDTDMYVKLVFGDPEPADGRPTLRTYTIRAVDREKKEIALDFVVHGDAGLAGPWARSVQPGEEVRFLGPGSGYRPNPEVDWHLLACDEAGLPAVAAALAGMPADAKGTAFIEVAGPADELPLDAPAGIDVTWIHRGVASDELTDDNAGDNAPLVTAVRAAEWPAGRPQVFIHGEAAAVMHNLRRYVRKDRGVPAADASISGYWRRGRTEEGFREWKADLREAEAAAGSAL
ncbi:siderophore-interacting protein [Jongsikchunia kroppenstedtii]|uniref:siderophore-interacting protein n=1 Tax=Jongsikchunia kroppenstedtii TaxID=1121721 RepID=UPI0004780203|nr:siderophore-interacting protein [Jongsikchunia kroppenstedtii]